MPSKEKRTCCIRGVREPNHFKKEAGGARYLVDDFIIGHLVGRILRRVCAQKDAYQIHPVPFFRTFPDKVAREALRIVQKCAQPTVLAQREVADIVEQRFRDIVPQRPEY